MKIAVIAAALLFLPALARAERKIAVEGSTLKVPNAWVEYSDLADKAKEATLAAGGLDAWASAWGSPEKAPLALAIHVRTHDTITKTMPEEFDDFHNGLKSTMEQGGAVFASFKRTNAPTFSISRFEAAQSGVKILGVAFAGVETDGHLDGWTAECIYAADADASRCADVMKGFEVTRAASYFRALDGGKPATTPPPRKHH